MKIWRLSAEIFFGEKGPKSQISGKFLVEIQRLIFKSMFSSSLDFLSKDEAFLFKKIKLMVQMGILTNFGKIAKTVKIVFRGIAKIVFFGHTAHRLGR
jgi:hypothetical protein